MARQDMAITAPRARTGMLANSGGGIRGLLLIALAVFACALPFLLEGYHVYVATQLLIYAIAIQGINLLTGYSGQLSFGHSAFFAIGAYVVAGLYYHFGVPYAAGMAVGTLLCLALGFLFGLPLTRLEKHYLALATFALAIAVPQILKISALQPWTGGVGGLVIKPVRTPFGLPLSDDRWLYFVVLLITALCFGLAWNLTRGRIGRALVAIRDQQTAATTMGVNVALYKATVFGISAMLTGIAGGLSAMLVQFVSPDSFPWFLSITLVVGAAIGGLASIWGPIFGAFFVHFVPEFAEEFLQTAPLLPYGILLIFFMVALPTGIAGLLRGIIRRVLNRGRSPGESNQ